MFDTFKMSFHFQLMTDWVVAHPRKQTIAGREWQAMAAVVRRTAAYDGLLG